MTKRQELINTILDLQDDVRELMYQNSDYYSINDYDLVNSDINSYVENDFISFKNNKDLERYIKYLKEYILKEKKGDHIENEKI